MGRRYDQYCPVARTLDAVGDRWTLLIVRELLLGPRRFTDLADGLPGVATSVLTDRLKQLDDEGLVVKRTLPPPAASIVYELTDEAVGLAAVVAAMAGWGRKRLGQPRRGEEVRARWLVLGLSVTADGEALPDATFVLVVDGESFTVRVSGGHLQPRQGAAADPDATITLSTATLVIIASGQLARVADPVEITGDRAAARRLLRALSSP